MMILTIVCYLLSAYSLKKQPIHSSLLPISASLLAAALILHALDLSNMVTTNSVNFNLYYSLSIMLWWVGILFAFLLIKNPLNILASILYLVVAVILAMAYLGFNLESQQKWLSFEIALHIFFSILAYSLLFLTFFQSVVCTVQDNYLRHKNQSNIARLLPPLETMEKLLFQLLNIGFILLSLSLVSGFFFLEDLFAQHLVHKTVLSIIAWILFLIILLGHKRFGWRSRQSRLMIQIAFVLLLLGYSGSKFVLEQLL